MPSPSQNDGFYFVEKRGCRGGGGRGEFRGGGCTDIVVIRCFLLFGLRSVIAFHYLSITCRICDGLEAFWRCFFFFRCTKWKCRFFSFGIDSVFRADVHAPPGQHPGRLVVVGRVSKCSRWGFRWRRRAMCYDRITVTIIVDRHISDWRLRIRYCGSIPRFLRPGLGYSHR